MSQTQTINPDRLFLASRMALVATAMTFAIRANLMQPLGTQFGLDSTQLGVVVGTAFWGFTLAMIFGGPLVDVIGMKRILIIAFVGHAAGIVLTVLSAGYWSLFLSTLLIGIANGMVEAACNPLIATIYAERKTMMLNRFHVWFPGGIVIGGLTAYFIENIAGLSWHYQMWAIAVPLAAYGFLFFGQNFPETERVASGVTTGEMFKETLRPLFIFMVLCMFLTAGTELGTGQWIDALLSNAGVDGILLLVFINGLMVVGRSFAGPIERKLSPAGMLLFSAVFSCIGLIALSFAQGPALFAAAGVFAVGICFFWPTMLGFTAEYMPKTGALGLAIMGGAGMLAVSFVLPFMGQLYDAQTAAVLPEGANLAAVKAAAEGSENAGLWAKAQLEGGANTLRYVAAMPAVLIVAFGALYAKYGNKKAH